MIFDQNELGRFEVSIPENEPVYPLNIACRILHMQYWTVHVLIKEGILKPTKTRGHKKLLSRADMKLLNYVRYLMLERGVNVKGVKVIFEIEKK